jgi:hypothetical protein
LDGGFRQRRRPPRREGPVERGHLGLEQLEGDAVGDQVVDRRRLDVVLAVHAEEDRPQQRQEAQVEGPSHRLAGRPLGLGLAPFVRQAGEVDQRHHRLEGRMDLLHRTAVPLRKGGAEDLVPRHHHRHRAAERRDVERSLQALGAVDVVDRARGVELLDEPEPLLVDRQGTEVRLLRPAPRDGLESRPGSLHHRPRRLPHRQLEEGTLRGS